MSQSAAASLGAQFTEALLEMGVLLTGRFKLKNGTFSPYFFDFGLIGDGDGLYRLGIYYAQKIIQDIGVDTLDILFGPAFKGIPIAISTALALHREFGISKGYCFNRPVEKDHGEGGLLLGSKLTSSSRVLLVDDVITDGGTKVGTLEFLRKEVGCHVMGVLVGVDRTESPRLLQEFTANTGLPVWSITSTEEVGVLTKA